MKSIFTILLFFACANLHAQDLITTRKGEVVKAKVSEVTPSEIKYKRFDNPDGPSYTVKKNEIASIVYQNGTVDAFGAENPVSADKKAENEPENTENPIRNEIILGLNSGVSLPIGLYGSSNSNNNNDGNAGAGSASGLDFGSNFKGSRFGWLLTGFITNHPYVGGRSSSSGGNGSSGNSFSGNYYNSGILLGATYALPLKNRSALTFSAQLGHIGTRVPSFSSYVETGNQYTPATYQKIQTSTYSSASSGFLIDLGASYRLHFRKTHFYLLGKLNYQGASTNVSSSVTVNTIAYNPVEMGLRQTVEYYNTSYTHAYSVINIQAGFGFFLK